MTKATKSVSWAPGLKLCQVRLFLSEDAPVLSGSDVQDHLQAKSSRLWHSSIAGSDESLPPGFELFNPINHFKIDFSQIPLIQWRYPLQFDLNPEWLLVAGEESVEVHSQNRTQLGVLEAIYPRPSSIPPNPSVSSEAHCHYDDTKTPLVPITPIEDEDSDPSNSILPFDATVTQNLPGHVAMPMKYESQQTQGNAMVAQNQSSTGTQASVSTHGVEPDVAAAASLAFTAIMTSGGRDSLVDHELLIKILSDPNLVEKLASDRGAPLQELLPPAAPSSHPTPLPMTSPSPHTHISSPLPISQPGLHHRANFVTTNALNSPIAEVRTAKDPIVTSSVHPSGMRDMTYYKSLIEQHGDEKRGTWDPSSPPQFGNRHGDDGEVMQGLKQRDTKLRVAKPCAYFNTPRGCKHGASCLYLHDASLPPAVERRNPKRIKLDREITGRN